ncbi:MAG: c-type cytochrome [Actinomycetota bacterium]|nr:c-type cytochrome [Actinomycetota bacterium]MDQ3575899.1 c-type cytochrome [Actinomycetota bacterium]
MSRSRVVLVTAALGAGVLAACNSADKPVTSTMGNAELGKEAIQKYGCGSCHTIPGVKEADGLVGPPLTHFAERSFIAGQLANTEENLARWIRDPQAVEPGTAMPNLHVSDTDAQNIAAYITTIE